MSSLQSIVPVLLALGSSILFADQVAFKNGDRLTGAIVKSDTTSLVIKTAVAGEVAVSWKEIRELHSDLPLHVELADGKVLKGKMTSREERVEIATDTGTTLEASKESVVALRNDAEQAAYDKSKHPGVLRGWDGSLNAGAEVTRGNSETRNFRLAFRAERKVSSNRLILSAESLYSVDDIPDALPRVTANETRGAARFDRDLNSRFFVFANADFASDALQDLNLRSVLGAGVGIHLIQSDRTRLDLRGGANFTRENYVQIQRKLGAGQAGEEFKCELGKNTSLTQEFALFPELTETGGNYRTDLSLGTVTRIIRWLGWQNNLSDTYITNPPEGKKRNEFVFTSGLNLAFSH